MIGWLVVAGCSFLLFVNLASEFVQEGEYARLDGVAAESMHRLASAGTTRFFQTVSDLHDTLPVCVAVVVIAAGLLLRKAHGTLGLLIAAVPGGMLLNVAIKHVLQRPRPALSSIPTAESFSFPSGHTAAAALLYGFLLAWVFLETRSVGMRVAASAIA